MKTADNQKHANRRSRACGNAFSASAPDIPAAVAVPVPHARLVAAFRRRLATLAAENAALRELLADTETLNLALERARSRAEYARDAAEYSAALRRAEILETLLHADAPTPPAN